MATYILICLRLAKSLLIAGSLVTKEDTQKKIEESQVGDSFFLE